MIHFLDVTKTFASKTGYKVILEPTSLSIPSNRSIGILGRNGAGKSTILKMVAGLEKPDTGRIIKETNISWPLGFSGGFHNDLTGRENVSFIARIYNADPAEIIPYVEDFSELDEYFDMPLRTYSTGMRARLAFGTSMAIDFGYYLIDEITAVGDRKFQEKCRAQFQKRKERSGMLIVSHNASTIKSYCDHALVLKRSILFPFDDVDQAIDFYENS